MKHVSGGLLLQDADTGRVTEDELKVVTWRPPTAEELRSLIFAWRVCKHVKSNAIVYARDGQTVGVGAGQMSRVDAARFGAQKAVLPLKGTVAASDAFFPFPDGLEAVAAAGATAVIQPGGSVKDEDVIAAADRLRDSPWFSPEFGTLPPLDSAQKASHGMTTFAESQTLGRARFLSLARQMDWFRGLRAAVALCTPLVIGDVAGLPILSWAALGGFEAILADTGGPYRSRLASLATLSFGGAAGLFLGCIAGRSLVWAVPVTIVFCFFWSYLAVLGQPFSSAGLLVQVIYICGIGAPPADWPTALNWSTALFMGGVWAAVLSLLLWPLDAYRPARLAVADCYNELASFLGSVYDLAMREQTNGRIPGPALWHRLAQHHQYRIRRAVEQGWQAVANVQGDRQADSERARQFVVLLEHADLLIARTVALAEHLEARATNQSDSTCFQRGLESLSDLRSAEQWIASLLMRRRSLTVAHARAKWSEMDRLPQYLAGCLDSTDPNDRFLLAQVAESASILQSSIEGVHHYCGSANRQRSLVMVQQQRRILITSTNA